MFAGENPIIKAYSCWSVRLRLYLISATSTSIRA